MTRFDSDPLCFDLHNELDERVIGEIENTVVVCNKTQVSFFRKHMQMCAFLLRVRKKRYTITVTIALRRKPDSCRVYAVTEPYPERFTHHIGAADILDIDS